MQRKQHMTRGDYEALVVRDGRIPGDKNRRHTSRDWLELHGWTDATATPRALPALELIASLLPGFTWEMRRGGARNRHYLHTEHYPHVNGALPSLADLVRHCTGEHPLQFDTLSAHAQRYLEPVVAVPQIGAAFSAFIARRCHLPTPRLTNAIATWLNRVARGEPSLVFVGVCPDWTTRSGRYTFEGVGSGIGLVAQRFLAALPELAATVAQHHVCFTVAIGDFEGESEATCARVGITQQEFRKRCVQSQLTFRDAALAVAPGINLDTPLATDFVGGNARWHQLLEFAARRIARYGLAAAHGVNEDEMAKLLAARASLYKRWHGNDVDVAAVFAAQAPEYGAMGNAAQLACDNVLVIGADAVAMAPSLQLLAPQLRPLPVLSLRAPDY